jgi:hypothetical protein
MGVPVTVFLSAATLAALRWPVVENDAASQFDFGSLRSAEEVSSGKAVNDGDQCPAAVSAARVRRSCGCVVVGVHTCSLPTGADI